MEFNAAISQIIILFIIMFVGIYAKKKGIITESAEHSFSAILVKIGLPALVLSSTNFTRNSDVLPNTINILIITVVSYFIMVIICAGIARLLKLKQQTANAFISLIVFANVGYMGYPVAQALFSDVGVFYTAIVNLVFSMLVWTFGILLYNRKSKVNFKNLINAGTISAFIAIFLFLFNIKMPFILQSAFELTGKMTFPLSMILIGAMIADIRIKDLFSDYKVYIVSFLRLLFFPIATAIILKLLNFNATVISLCTVMAAMPSAAVNAIFANEFNSEPIFSSIGVFVSTLLSIATIPAILYLLTYLI